LIAIITGFIYPEVVRAAFEPKCIGSQYVGAGCTGILSESIRFATFVNPAKLVGNQEYRLDVYVQKYYALKSLYLKALDCTGLIRTIPLGIAISKFGNELYEETEIVLGSALKINNLYAGFSLRYYDLHISRYGSSASMGVSLSGIYLMSDATRLGFVLINLNEPEIGKCRGKIPVTFELGLQHEPAENIYLRIEVSKTDDYPFDYRFGLEYDVAETFSLLCGFKEKSNSVCLGTSVAYGKLCFSYAFDYHIVLGLTNTLSMGYAY
jgi:hypothetical protein